MESCFSESLPSSANSLGGKFVLTIKGEGTKNGIGKARFVVQGQKDKLKSSLVHNIAVARQHSTKMLVRIVTIKKVQLFSSDVNQAYIQGE